MKILIWVLCTLVYSVVSVLLSNEGVVLGGFQTIVLGTVLLLAPAPLLCRLWDKRKAREAAETMEPAYRQSAAAVEQPPAPEATEKPAKKAGRGLRTACAVLAVCAVVLSGACAYLAAENGELSRKNQNLSNEIAEIEREAEWGTGVDDRHRAMLALDEALQRFFYAYGDRAWEELESILDQFS